MRQLKLTAVARECFGSKGHGRIDGRLLGRKCNEGYQYLERLLYVVYSYTARDESHLRVGGILVGRGWRAVGNTFSSKKPKCSMFFTSIPAPKHFHEINPAISTFSKNSQVF